MATGSGNSLGSALLDLAAELGGAPHKSSYTAKGWHAQISRITSTKAGYEAADRVGLTVSERTLKGWLSWAGDGDPEPSKANQALIAKAYVLAGAGRWPDWERKTFRVYGEVEQGGDVRDRGGDGTSPLLVEGTDASGRVWAEFKEDWEKGGITEDQIDGHFGVICMDALGGSDPWDFPGTSYTVTAV